MAAEGAAPLSASTTRSQAQRLLARAFAEAGFETAEIDARILLCAGLAVDHAALVRDPDLPVGEAADALAAFLTRRLRHEPVSRITGRREFWGLPLTVTPDVLDPRPDTEVVVEAIVALLGRGRGRGMSILDLGTGSGALLCALLHECPDAYGVGIDYSLAACRVAQANLQALGLAERGAIIQGWWSNALRGQFDVVVGNPPYVAHAELARLGPEVAGYDPPAALDGGPDGLDPYRVICPELPRLLRAGGIAALEGGWDQGERISAMMERAGLETVELRRDLAGHRRVAVARHIAAAG